MPITEPPKAGTPLSQGDILKGVRLFFSKRSADASWECASDRKVDMCLVLSRQCVVKHKKLITVAAIEKYPSSIPTDLDFKSALLSLENLRDGNKSPDLFYLGLLPTTEGRFCARLDFLATIEIPPIPAERQKFIDENRVAKLCTDYIRDLHVRVLQSFARMGFEDYRWVSDEDLRWLVKIGKIEIDKHRGDQEARQAAREAEGKPGEEGELSKIADIKKRMRPYEEELSRRFPEPPLETTQDPLPPTDV